MTEAQFVITIASDAEHEAEELGEGARQLREDLAELDFVQLSEVAAGPPEEGTRSASTLVQAAMGVTLTAGGLAAGVAVATMAAGDIAKLVKSERIRKVSAIIREWVRRNPNKRVIVKHGGDEYDFTNFDVEEINAVLDRFATPRTPNEQ